MSPGEKRVSWRRITLEGDSWRFNRYAERALEKGSPRAAVQCSPPSLVRFA
jgi:hypothetical protein